MVETYSSTVNATNSITSTDQDLIYLILDLLDREKQIKDFNECPGGNTIVLHEKIIPNYNLDVGLIPLGFAYLISKENSPYRFFHSVDRAAKYNYESNLPKLHNTWINIFHDFLVIYTNCYRLTSGRKQNRINSIIRNVWGFDLLGEKYQPDLPASQHAIEVTE